MATTKHARICRTRHKKRRLDADTLLCGECSGVGSFYLADESPAVLTGRWVPHPSLPIRVYEEQVA